MTRKPCTSWQEIHVKSEILQGKGYIAYFWFYLCNIIHDIFEALIMDTDTLVACKIKSWNKRNLLNTLNNEILHLDIIYNFWNIIKILKH